MATLSKFSNISTSAIGSIHSFEYHPMQKYNFATRTLLSEELSKSHLLPLDIVRWTWQIAECIRHEYYEREDCPSCINPRSILLDANKDVVHHTVVFDRWQGTCRHEIRFIDCIARIHSTLFECMYSFNVKRHNFAKLALFDIVAKQFYNAAICGHTDISIQKVCEFIGEMQTMVEYGIITEISKITTK